MSPAELAIASVVMAIGSAVQGALGFGLNLIAAPVLLNIDPELVPGPALAAAAVLTVLIAVRERAGFDLRELGWAFTGRVPGTVLGAAAVATLSARGLSVALSALVLVAVGLSLSGWHLSPTPRTLAGAGLVSGFMGTVTSIGGPPMALVYQRQAGAIIRSRLSSYFVVGTIVSLVALGIAGEVGSEELVASAALVPGVLVGFALSRSLAGVLDKGWTRPAVLLLSAASALVALVRALT